MRQSTHRRKAERESRQHGTTGHVQPADTSKYYLPHNSYWPILGSVALFSLMAGAVRYLNDWTGGYVFLPGAILLATMFFVWFGTVIDENQHGVYNSRSTAHSAWE